jgi:NAD(P)-dependent dehydrogenase (short-subunit alcohol dehydrogenase family)
MNLSKSSLAGKTVVITGGGGVLCSGFAKVMAAQGCSVAVLDLNLASAEKVVLEIIDAGGSAVAAEANVLDMESLNKAHDEVISAFGKCDILINGAGGNNPKGTTSKEYFEPGDIEDKDLTSFFDLDFKGVSFVFDLNFLGTLMPTQVFAKDMLGRTGCAIINISSMSAFKPLTKIPAYSAAKAAVSNFTEWLAVHFAEQGIRVNAIAPGFFDTAQNHALLFDANGDLTPRSEKILGMTPMGRFGEPEELAGTLL